MTSDNSALTTPTSPGDATRKLVHWLFGTSYFFTGFIAFWLYFAALGVWGGNAFLAGVSTGMLLGLVLGRVSALDTIYEPATE